MKALISPDESFNFTWISNWVDDNPVESTIFNCQRIAQVETDSDEFEVALPLYWVDCPDNCNRDDWYYKDGKCFLKPKDLVNPKSL
jgi:hypothetical protein